MVSKHSRLRQITLFVTNDDWLHSGQVDSGEEVTVQERDKHILTLRHKTMKFPDSAIFPSLANTGAGQQWHWQQAVLGLKSALPASKLLEAPFLVTELLQMLCML